jgi:uncharacterized small protein (DUF1192 family)
MKAPQFRKSGTAADSARRIAELEAEVKRLEAELAKRNAELKNLAGKSGELKKEE